MKKGSKAGILSLLLATALGACSPQGGPKVTVFSGHTQKALGRNNGPGAVSFSGISENHFNDGVLDQFVEIKAPEVAYSFFLTSDNIRFQDRPNVAADHKADLYVEVHHDSPEKTVLERFRKNAKTKEDWKELSGFSISYSERNPYSTESLLLARMIGQELVNCGFHPSRHLETAMEDNLVDRLRGVYQRNKLHVLSGSRMPAVIVEGGMICNPYAEGQLKNPAIQREIADAVNRAIKNYFARQNDEHHQRLLETEGD